MNPETRESEISLHSFALTLHRPITLPSYALNDRRRALSVETQGDSR
jgi:hypothetical protein